MVGGWVGRRVSGWVCVWGGGEGVPFSTEPPREVTLAAFIGSPITSDPPPRLRPRTD